MPRLQDVVAALERRYPTALAEPWDAVGLVCGDPDDRVARVLFAVDPVDVVVDEALGRGADLLVTHHPLLLRAVHGVPSTDAKGRVVHRLLRGGAALYAAHTNADAADPGVSDAMAAALGLVDLRPLAPVASEPLDKVVTFVPDSHLDRVLDAVHGAGAGVIGGYDRCSFTTPGTGRFRGGEGTSPAVGRPGRVEAVAEVRVETVVPRRRRAAVVSALLAAHPYEEPAFDVLELAAMPSTRGIGRVGRLPEPVPLSRFAADVAAALPATVAGVRFAGDPDAVVRSVAVCGGAGDSLLAAAADAGADVYVTSDLRHHRAQEHLADGGCGLVDVPHWAAEWTWLPVAAAALRDDLAAGGDTVDVAVSTACTDPWTGHVRSPE